MATWDAIVIGLGGVGSAAAFHLASAGHRVLGVDQYPAAHDRGSSHGQTRIIRQAYFESPAYVPLLKRAYHLWSEAEEQSGRQLFCRTGLLEIGPADGMVIPGILASAQQHDLSIEQLTAAEVRRAWPAIWLHDDWPAVMERDAGFLRVEDCVLAHLRLAFQQGASCVHGTTVQDWQADGEGVAVFTDHGIERAGRLIIAAGPWSQKKLSALSPKLTVLRKHQYWFRADSQMKWTERFPCFFHETPEGCFYGFPSIDDSGVKVARHSGGQPISQPTQTHPDDAIDRSLVERYVARYLPGVRRELMDHAGCYYTSTPDKHFVVDIHPEYPQVTVVAGLSGHGFKFTSVLGEIAAQLAITGRTKWEIELFRIGRLREE